MSNLHKISASCGEPDLPQQIYSACLNQQAFLFVRDGVWCVLKPVVDGGEVGVLVWAAWSGRPDGMVQYTDFIKQRAREIDAGWIRFHTIRHGFIRVAQKYGWCRMADDSRGRLVFQMAL
jgi:hypothetical protein